MTSARRGRAGAVLSEVARECDASLIVVGRHGRAAETLLDEAVTWSADVLVVGSKRNYLDARVVLASR